MSETGKQGSLIRRTASLFNEALRDNDEDFTQGPVRRALALLAIPMMLEMAMESIFAVVDIAFVSRLGTDAVAAVGITEALVTVLYAVAIGLGMGLTAMVARRIGEQDADAAALVRMVSPADEPEDRRLQLGDVALSSGWQDEIDTAIVR